jgi:hypothetical protein
MKPKLPEWLPINYEKLRADYNELRRRLREMEKFSSDYGIKLEPDDEPNENGAVSQQLSELGLRDATVRVLQDQGEPMAMGALLDALQSRGVEVGGENPRNTLYGSIYGDKRLCRLGKARGMKWGLVDRDGPEHDARSSDDTETDE